jgi:hypothetical protein
MATSGQREGNIPKQAEGRIPNPPPKPVMFAADIREVLTVWKPTAKQSWSSGDSCEGQQMWPRLIHFPSRHSPLHVNISTWKRSTRNAPSEEYHGCSCRRRSEAVLGAQIRKSIRRRNVAVCFDDSRMLKPQALLFLSNSRCHPELPER